MDPRQARPEARPRSKSNFSFSNRSNASVPASPEKNHKRQVSLQETSAEKRKNHMSETTKANPNAAIHEAQPSALALEESTLQTLNNIRCTDIYGKPIEPDRSNPTRSTHERPLETIRAFEFAIDRQWNQRQSGLYQGPDGASAIQSRRSSTYWAGNQSTSGLDQNGRFSNFSGGRPNPGYGGPSRDSFGEHSYGQPPPRFGRGMQSDPALNRYPSGGQGGVYPAVGNSRSRDTLNTNGASSGSEPLRDVTQPTSEENSLDRAHGVIKPNGNGYGNGYGDGYGPQYSDDERGYPRGGYGTRTPHSIGANSSTYFQQNQTGPQPLGPPVPAKSGPAPPPPQKNIIRLGLGERTMASGGAVQPAKSQGERNSWFKKRFSRGK